MSKMFASLCLVAVATLCLASIASGQEIAAVGIASVSPASGPVGSQVTITGSGFGAVQGSSAVTLSGVVATPTAWSDTKIILGVPQQAPTGPLVVKVGSASSKGVLFKVTP